MPDQTLTCAQLQAATAEGYLSQQKEEPAPGGGSVLIDCRWHPAAGATRAAGCDGPVFYLRVRNNSGVLGRALLPNKKQGQPWLDGAPGTDVILDTVARPGDQTTLNNLGLVNYADVTGTRITFP